MADKEFLIWGLSSCVLILAVIALRAVFGGRMTPKARYWLWLVVLVRLLVPGTVLQSAWSVAMVAERARQSEPVQFAETVAEFDFPRMSFNEAYQEIVTEHEAAGIDVGTLRGSALEALDYEAYSRMNSGVTIRVILRYIWYAGIAVTAAVFLVSNLRFYLRLRKRRKLLVMDCKLPVYSVEKLSSSCLFIRSIYISAETAEDAVKLRHVLAHEFSHYHHGDGVWAILRCAALALHWYNPLVWWAAVLSRRDGELFADWGALQKLGEDEREKYGVTLIKLSAKCKNSASLLCTATTMAGGRKALKERIVMIAKRPRMTMKAAFLVCLILGVCIGCAFTGAKPEQPEGGENATEPTAWITPTPVLVSASDLDAFNAKIPIRFEPERAIVVPFTGERSIIIETARDYVSRQIDYFNELGQDSPLGEYAITDAKITVLEEQKINIRPIWFALDATVAETYADTALGLSFYHMKFRLLPDRPENVMLAGGMTMEDGWINAGWDICFLFAREPDADGIPGEPLFIGATTEQRILEEYAFPAFIEEFGDPYTAAAIDMYRDWKFAEGRPYYVELYPPDAEYDRRVRVEGEDACKVIWDAYQNLYGQGALLLDELEDSLNIDVYFRAGDLDALSFTYGWGRLADGTAVYGRCSYIEEAGRWRMVEVKDGAHYWELFNRYYLGYYAANEIVSGAPLDTVEDLIDLQRNDPEYYEQLMRNWRLEANVYGVMITAEREDDYESVMRQWAETWAGMHLGVTSAQNPFRCTGAEVTGVGTYTKTASPTDSPRRLTFDVTLALRPADAERFCHFAYPDTGTAPLGEDGWYLLTREITLQSSDGKHWITYGVNTGESEALMITR